MKKLKRSPNVACLSVTKKVYELGTFRLVQNKTIESKVGRATKEKTYQALRSCLSSDSANITAIVRDSKLPDSVLFEIADKVKHDGNAALAHAVREASRSFNLESAVEHACDQISTHCIKEEQAQQMTAALRENLSTGRYERIYDGDDLAEMMTQDLQAVSNNRHVFVLPKPPAAADGSARVQSDGDRAKELQSTNFGFGNLRTPPRGTTYLDIRKLENPKEVVGNKHLARDFALAAFKQVVDSKPEAVVIDLRNNGGGSVYMVELMLSHFLEEGVPLFPMGPAGKG